MKFGPFFHPNEDRTQGNQKHEAKDHERSVRRGLPVVIARGPAVERRALANRVLGQDRQISLALRSFHIDCKGAVLAVHLEARIWIVAGKSLLGAQSVNRLLVGRRHVDVAFASSAGGPASTVLVADGVEGHVAALDAGAVECLELEVGIVLGLVVSVGQARREGDVVFVVVAAVEDQEQRASHFVAAEANGAPGALRRHAQAEVDVCIAIFGDGEGEGEGAVRADEG